MICNCNHLHENINGIEKWGKVDVFEEEFDLVFKIKNVFSSFVKISCTRIMFVLFCEIKAELRPNILMVISTKFMEKISFYFTTHTYSILSFKF